MCIRDRVICNLSPPIHLSSSVYSCDSYQHFCLRLTTKYRLVFQLSSFLGEDFALCIQSNSNLFLKPLDPRIVSLAFLYRFSRQRFLLTSQSFSRSDVTFPQSFSLMYLFNHYIIAPFIRFSTKFFTCSFSITSHKPLMFFCLSSRTGHNPTLSIQS